MNYQEACQRLCLIMTPDESHTMLDEAYRTGRTQNDQHGVVVAATGITHVVYDVWRVPGFTDTMTNVGLAATVPAEFAGQ